MLITKSTFDELNIIDCDYAQFKYDIKNQYVEMIKSLIEKLINHKNTYVCSINIDVGSDDTDKIQKSFKLTISPESSLISLDTNIEEYNEEEWQNTYHTTFYPSDIDIDILTKIIYINIFNI